jgi:hypothetical protein
MQRSLNARYLIKTVKALKKANIKPVKIDFPLPSTIQGIESRLNSLNTYQIPESFIKKNKPVHIVGKNVRLSHLL